jgi:heme exporter protein A
MQACQLSAEDLACRRGDRLLFAGLSFTLAPGEALQVTGSNGIGKSSLIRIVAGLLRAFQGRVSSEGSIGLIDERLALDEHQPLGAALGFWSGIDGGGFLARESTVDALGLLGLLDVPVRYLSTGQRKRAAMARLIGQQAPIWLLDEPLNGLDSDAAQLVGKLAAAHCEAGGICLVASHQPLDLPDKRVLGLEEFAP